MNLSDHIIKYLSPKKVDEYIIKTKPNTSKGPIVPYKIDRLVGHTTKYLKLRESPERCRHHNNDSRV